MSYWVYLEQDGGPVEVRRHAEGGTYILGGTSAAELNVTYNYSRVYSPHDFSLRDLDGKTAGETTPELEALVSGLGTCQSGDYWEPTPGNAGHALDVLLGWARQHPQAVWRVSLPPVKQRPRRWRGRHLQNRVIGRQPTRCLRRLSSVGRASDL